MNDTVQLDLDALSDGETLSALGDAIRDGLTAEGSHRWLRGSASWLGGKAFDAINDAVKEFDLIGALATAWAGAREIAEHADPAKYPSKRSHRLRLGKHDIDMKLNPRLTLSAAGWHSPPIQFTMTMTAAVEAVELRIRQGFLIGMGCGACELKISLSRGDATLMPARSLRKFDLPGDHRFKEPGIDVRPLALRGSPHPA